MQPLTWNTDSEALPGGATRARISGKWRNFLGVNGWQPIDLSIRQAGGLFSVSQAPYALDVPTLANNWASIQSTNRYDIWTKRVMPDAPVGIQKRYPAAVPVAGTVTPGGILFASAFPGLNADRLVQPHEQQVRDLVVFRSRPPGAGNVLVPVEIDFGTLGVLENRAGLSPEAVDFTADRDLARGLSFTTGSGFRGLAIKPPRVWDSAGRSAPILLRGRFVGTRFVGAKVIPRAFLDAATYPVYADTTSTFYPDFNPESTCVDGQVTNLGPSVDWSVIHDATAGTSADDSSVILGAEILADTVSNKWGRLIRVFLLFDTSILSGSTVSAASLGMYVTSKTSDFGGNLDLVTSSPASNTSLVVGDFDQLGTTLQATSLALSGLTTSAYNVFTLNATGLSNVSLGGVSKFGLRISADTANTAPTWSSSGNDSAVGSSADESGSQDPYLEVTYSADNILMPQICL